jgi:hypothetical protein
MKVMSRAETTYAAMAIPFHIAVYNEFLITALEMLKSDGQALEAEAPHKLMLGPLREALRVAGMVMPADQERVMDFAQKLRNSIVHDGATARTGVISVWNDLTPTQQELWAEDAGRSPELVLDERISLGPGEVRATLAVATLLGRAVNDELERLISRDSWIRIVIDDWCVEHPGKWSDWERRSRNAYGWARHNYGSLAITIEEIEPVMAARC